MEPVAEIRLMPAMQVPAAVLVPTELELLILDIDLAMIIRNY